MKADGVVGTAAAQETPEAFSAISSVRRDVPRRALWTSIERGVPRRRVRNLPCKKRRPTARRTTTGPDRFGGGKTDQNSLPRRESPRFRKPSGTSSISRLAPSVSAPRGKRLQRMGQLIDFPRRFRHSSRQLGAVGSSPASTARARALEELLSNRQADVEIHEMGACTSLARQSPQVFGRRCSMRAPGASDRPRSRPPRARHRIDPGTRWAVCELVAAQRGSSGVGGLDSSLVRGLAAPRSWSRALRSSDLQLLVRSASKLFVSWTGSSLVRGLELLVRGLELLVRRLSSSALGAARAPPVERR
jgi:hypothetical protein